MGLLLSILVVCVGVVEAISCFRHIQNGYLPFWLPNRFRPMITEHGRRKPSVDEDSSSSSEEISRILINGNAHEPSSYGLTPILTEHRRNTPILRDEESDAEANKYVENNIDESISNNSHCSENGNLIIEHFRPISPSSEPEEVVDKSLVSSSGKFVEVTETPERCTSVVTVCDDENEPESINKTTTINEDVQYTNQISFSKNSDLVEIPSQLIEEVEPKSELKTPTPMIDDEQNNDNQDRAVLLSRNISQIEEIANQIVNDVILQAQIATQFSDEPSQPVENKPLETAVDTTSPTGHTEPVINVDSELPLFHKHPLSFDLSLTPTSSSRPATPSTPRKVKADISWPVFHPDVPVIKRPSISLVSRRSMSRGDSIDEDVGLGDEDLALDYDVDEIKEDEVEINTDNQEEMLLLVSKELCKSMAMPPLDISLNELVTSPQINSSTSPLLDISQYLETQSSSNQDALEGRNTPLIDESSSLPVDVSSTVTKVPLSLELIDDISASQYPIISEHLLTESTTNQSSSSTQQILSSSVLEPDVQSSSNTIVQSLDEQLPTNAVPVQFPETSDISPKVKISELDINVIEDYFSKATADPSAALFTTPFIEIPGESQKTTSIDSTEKIRKISQPCKTSMDQFGRIVDMPISEERLRSIESMIESPSSIEKPFVKTTTKDTDRMVSLKDILFEPECQKKKCYTVATDDGKVETICEPECSVSKTSYDSTSDNKSKDEVIEPDVKVTKNEESTEQSLVDAIIEPVCVSSTGSHITSIRDTQDPVSEPEIIVKTEITVTSPSERNDNVDPKGLLTSIDSEITRVNDTPEIVVEPKCAATSTVSETPDKIKSNLHVNVHRKSSSMDSTDSLSFDEPGNEDSAESVSLGKDITSKESSIKRRKSYRDKKRNITPKTSTEHIPEEPKEVQKDVIIDASISEKEKNIGDLLSALDCDDTILDVADKEVVKAVLFPDNAVDPVALIGNKDVEPAVMIADNTIKIEPPALVADKKTEPVEENTNKEVPVVVMRKKANKSSDEAPEVSKEDIVHRRESATEAILNKEILPVEVLHSSETNVESAVFATKREEPKKRLKKPARAESFEEAASQEPVRLDKSKPRRNTENDAKTEKQDSPQTNTPEPITKEIKHNVTKSAEQLEKLADPNARLDNESQKVSSDASESCESNETSPNDDDTEGAEADTEECSVSESDASKVKQPVQSSNPAFWLIFSGEYTKAMSKDWHSGHFCCWQCDESLTGQRYVLRDDHPYCIKCYESVFANMCEECNKTIGIDSKDLSYKDKHWHEACFLCNKCRVSLVDKQFGSKADKIYCGNCYDSQFASRCDGCGEIFRAGTKKMEYKTRQWHEKCFCCCVCKSAIGTKSFIPREQEIYCATCYEEKFATRCVKCNKIITSGGVTYKNEPWHRECFTCTHCNTSLAGQRFTSRDEKPYCAECFGELFAKRCTACVKPITGIGGTRFISFEDRHWHNDCFICATCKTSLVGRGFITDADDIICPECAKQKLM